MYIKYFDKAYSIEEGSYPYYFLTFCLQLLLIIFVLFYYFLNVFIDIRTKQYVTNIQRIHHCIYFSCVLGHVMLFIQRVLLILDFEAGENKENEVFHTISLVRAICCFPGFYCLSSFVVERCFATYYLDDYEKNQRGWLVPIILLFNYSIGIVSAFSFHDASSTIPHIVIFISLSCLATFVNNINFRMNRGYYFRSQRHDGGGYSLAQRFQISENIRFAFFFNQFAQSIAFFQILGGMCLLIDNLNISRSWKNLSTVVFDTAMPLYAVVTPYVVYHHNPKYQAELNHLVSLISQARRGKQVKPTETSEEIFATLKIRGTLGNELVFDNRQTTTNHYFNQLESSWR